MRAERKYSIPKFVLLCQFLASLILFTILPVEAQQLKFENSRQIVISPEFYLNPEQLEVNLAFATPSPSAIFVLYDLNAVTVFVKQLDLTTQPIAISGKTIFGEELPVFPGVYFYDVIEPDDSNNATQINGNHLFEDVSDARLPGDSLKWAYVEFTDVTGDSFPDIISGMHDVRKLWQPQIFTNDGTGNFTNETSQRFPEMELFVKDVLVIDINGDHLKDIYFAADNGMFPPEDAGVLLLNDGHGNFSDVSATHLPSVQFLPVNADWGFINNDTFPDLIVNSLITPTEGNLNVRAPQYLLINDGSGRFMDESFRIPDNRYYGYDSRITDVNNDGRNDIILGSLGDIVITDQYANILDSLSGRNAIFIQNTDGNFIDETAARVPEFRRQSKLIKLADINNDGAVDFYSINVGFSQESATNILYINDGSGYYQDETEIRMPPEETVWNNDVEFADFDQNGDVDFFMVNVVLGGPAGDNLYLNQGGSFSDATDKLPPLIDFNGTSAVADMELDEDLDIFISADLINGEGGSPDLLYENVSPLVGIHNRSRQSVESFHLFQNYPNPFNPTTNIRFQVQKAGFVELKIFDVSGRLVKTLVAEHLGNGDYSIPWNASNENGLKAGSGIYFYQLNTDEFRQTRKMLLLQ